MNPGCVACLSLQAKGKTCWRHPVQVQADGAQQFDTYRLDLGHEIVPAYGSAILVGFATAAFVVERLIVPWSVGTGFDVENVNVNSSPQLVDPCFPPPRPSSNFFPSVTNGVRLKGDTCLKCMSVTVFVNNLDCVPKLFEAVVEGRLLP